MGNKKALFFDIDGTLWDHTNHIQKSTIEGIRAARSNGHFAFICSGRARAYIQDPNLLAVGFDGVVAGCGTHIELDGKLIYQKLIDREVAVRTVETVRKYGMRPILEGPEYLYMDETEFGGEIYGQKLKHELKDRLVGISDHTGEWVINKLSCATEGADCEGCFNELQEYYTYLIHNIAVVEMVPQGHTKATGIAKVCEYLGIPRADTFAFGDSVNDLAMLEYAGVGVAMGSGTDDAKAAADYVTSDLQDDGIYRAMLHFGLI